MQAYGINSAAATGLQAELGDRWALMGSLAEQGYPRGVFADLLADGLRSGGVLKVLGTVRKYLGMDVAFVSHFRGTDRVLENVDSDGDAPVYPGQTIPLEEGYCLKVVLGQLPELMADTSRVPAAMAMPETRSIPIGSHLSVPIRLQTGDVYGTLCCFNYLPDLSLGERDLKMMRAFAEVLAVHVEEISVSSRARAAKVDSLRRAMSGNSPEIVYQPIYRLRTGELAGVECLSRFLVGEGKSPSAWFDLAEEVGLRQELELTAIRRALRYLDRFPASTWFGLNCSPETVLSGKLAETLQTIDLRRIVVEITEHAIVSDYVPLIAALRPLRERGLRLAIDDAGAGYASMRHIVNLLPDYIKLDMSLTRGIDKDPSRHALARALTSFSREIGSAIIAEGIETEGELELLRALGVETGQGFLLCRPIPLESACEHATFRCAFATEQIQLDLH